MSTWVLIRGLTREAGHWGDFPSRLSAHLNCARVVTVDTPGNGALHKMTSPTRIADMVTACRQHLSAQGLPPPYNLLAISLGGMVATEWAYRYPEELRHCILISTSFQPFSPFYHRLRPGSWLPLLWGQLCGGRALERTILNLTSTEHDLTVLESWTSIRRNHPVGALNALRQLIAAARFTAQRIKPSIPALLLAGAGDRLVDPRCSMVIAAQWGVPIRIHPTAGHDLTLDQPQWVADQIERWIRPH
ncbi:MAG: alpha/beta hydrolase [Burkholderiales bacterium]|nr:alpha/beta hydrolase [Burkholderiales bacterium]